MSLNSTPNHIEDNEIEMLIIASISTLKRSSKKCGKNEVFDLVQTSLDTDINRETFIELLQNMVESNAVKLRTVGDRECLSLPKDEAKDLDAINNKTKSDLEVFQLQLEKFKSILYERKFHNLKVISYAISQLAMMRIPWKSFFIRWKRKLLFYMKN